MGVRFKVSAFFLSAFALLWLATNAANAQQVFGSIYGTITDPSGSAVSNAKVTVTDVSKGTSFDVTTNESGIYQKGQLIPDQYTVTVEAPGFSKIVSNPIAVTVDQAAKFDASLQVGNVQQQVEVTASAPLLQTDRADVAQTFTSEQLQSLPNLGRNVQSFQLLNPGTVKMGWQHASDEDPQGSVQTIVNGQLFSSSGYELDGTTNQDPILGIIVVNPTMDSVNEAKQANQDFDAEFEYTGGGLFSYSTKSGSNAFHGDAFSYMQLNTPGFSDYGRNPFSEPNGAGTQHYFQFGGSIGGRIIKDKLFFFADTQLTRNHVGAGVLASVPTAQERGIGVTGGVSFSDWLKDSPGYPGCLTDTVNYPAGCRYQIYDPTTGDRTTGIGRTAFANNFIPTASLSSQALKLLQYFPLPNTNAFGTTYRNNYVASGNINYPANLWNTRWDYYGSEKDTFFARYSYAGYTLSGPGAFGTEAGGPGLSGGGLRYAGSSDALNQSVAVGWTHTAGPTLINELRFGYMRYHINALPGGYGTTPAADAGIPGLNLDKTFTSGMPYFDIRDPSNPNNSGSSDIKLGYSLDASGCNCPLTELETQLQWVDNVTKIAGNHNMKFGVDARVAQNLRVPSDTHRAGELTFVPGMTGTVLTSGGNSQGGLSLASFLLGDVNSFGRYYSNSTDATERQKRFFFYGQDMWHVTPKLTFTYGLRWELIFPETVNKPGAGASPDLNTGQMVVFGVGGNSSHGYQDMNWTNFAPRVSLAYQLTPKTVVRAGYGWSYNLGTFGSTFGHNVTQNPPVLIRQNINAPNNYTDVFTLGQGPPLPNAPAPDPNTGRFTIPDGIALNVRPATMTLPVVYQYNFSVQQQLTSKVSVTASYVGNVGRHGFLGITQNNVNLNTQPFIPGVINTNLDRPYNGLLGPKYDFGWTQNVNYYCDCGNSEYNSFQALFNVNAAAGYTLQGNYTYQVSQADAGAQEYNRDYLFLYDPTRGWANTDFLPHNQLTLAQNYAIPFGHGRKWGANVNRLVDLTLGGWTISGVTQYYSGVPFSPTLDNYPGQPNTGPN
ncbi:MAG: TonB-dependent receptor, partial [Acidobacteriaceae bacterium]|nr:TonB-dependent receptor [Acidobacteriaceae bacterium]